MTKNREAKANRTQIAAAVDAMMGAAFDAGVVTQATLTSFEEVRHAPAPGLGEAEVEVPREPGTRE